MITKVDESVYILNKINLKIQQSINTVNEVSVEFDIKNNLVEILLFTAMDLGLIHTISYLDELNEHFFKVIQLETEKQFLDNLTQKIKIPQKELQKRFPDLKLLRNSFLAHNMRMAKKDYKNIILDGDLRRLRVPQNLLDYIFVSGCIKMINVIVNNAFPLSYNNAEAYRIDSSKGIDYQKPQFENLNDVENTFNFIKTLIMVIE